MAKQINNDSEHDEIVSMLPWFVNRTLDGRQRATVQTHIDNCDECQREVQFLVSLNETVHSDAQDNLRVHADVEKNLASVMNRIDRESHQNNAMVFWPSVLQQKLGKVLEFATTLSGAQWGVTAVAGVLVAVLAFQLNNGQSDNDYSVLSSSGIDDSSMLLSVETTPATDQEQAQSIIQRELEKIGQQINIETKSDGVYVLEFLDAIDVSELSKFIIDLENEAQIKRVKVLP